MEKYSLKKVFSSLIGQPLSLMSYLCRVFFIVFLILLKVLIFLYELKNYVKMDIKVRRAGHIFPLAKTDARVRAYLTSMATSK